MARRVTLVNLQIRFPQATEEEILDALGQTEDHGGKATALLAKKHRPLPAVQHEQRKPPEPEEVREAERASDFAAARQLLEPYSTLRDEPLVDARSLAELREAMPDVPEATLAVELVRLGNDVGNAKSWLWRSDQGQSWRREQAVDISRWAHQTDGELAVLSSGPWTKKRLVLDRATEVYAYVEEVWSQYNSAGDSGICRTRHSGGRWVMEVQAQGFLLIGRGSMRTTVLNPENGARLDESDEEHELMLWTTVAPFPGLEEVRMNLPPLSKADKIKRRFREIDRNRDGTLEYSELKTLLTGGGKTEMSDKEVRALFNRLDKDHSGLISFDEFVDYLYPPKDSQLASNHAIYGSWYDDKDFRRVLKKDVSSHALQLPC